MSRHTRKRILILLTAALLCVCAGALAQNAPEETYRAALLSYNNADYDEARQLFAQTGDYGESAAYLAECDRMLTPVTIANAEAEARILAALAAEGIHPNGDVLVWQAEALTVLNLSGCMLYDVAFLESFAGLETLSIRDNAVADLSPLGSLYHLQTLDVSVNRIRDITPLCNLTALTALDFSDNDVACINALGYLTNLQTLNLSGNEVGSVTALQTLTRLESLNISNNFVAYLNPLGGLTNLRKLNLSNNRVESVLALRALINLEELDVSSRDDEALARQEANYMYVPPPDHYQIGDLDVIACFTELKKLNIAGNGLEDIRPLAALTELEELDMSDNVVCSFEALRGLTNLRMIKADGLGGPEWRFHDVAYEYGVFNHVARLSTLKPLSSLIKLKYLSTADNLITDLSPIQNLPNLQTLLLPNDDDLKRKYDLTDLSPLAGHTALKNLNFDFRYVSSLSPLYASVNLDTLSLNTCPLVDLNELRAFPHLKSLNLTRMSFPALDALEGLPELVTLNLTGTGTGTEYRLSLKPLRSLINLKTLYLDDCRGREYVYITELTQLEELVIESYDIDGEVNIMLLLDRLPNLRVLDLSGMILMDLRPLSALPLLETLKFKVSGIQTLDDLKPLTRLKTLQVHAVEDGKPEISDISALRQMKNLRSLAISEGETTISDLSALSACTELKELRVNNALIEDLSPLQSCPKLTFISLSANRITDLSPLSACTELEELQVADNPITDISLLAGHPYLGALDIERDPVKDISVITVLPSLGDICLSGVRYQKATEVKARLKEMGH